MHSRCGILYNNRPEGVVAASTPPAAPFSKAVIACYPARSNIGAIRSSSRGLYRRVRSRIGSNQRVPRNRGVVGAISQCESLRMPEPTTFLAISDVHGNFDEFDPRDLPEADAVLVAGDMTNMCMRGWEMNRCKRWLQDLADRYPAVFWIPGNHDIGV